MICEHSRRIKSIDEIIQRLDTISAKGQQPAFQPNPKFDQMKD
jgi:hypothetical protein